MKPKPIVREDADPRHLQNRASAERWVHPMEEPLPERPASGAAGCRVLGVIVDAVILPVVWEGRRGGRAGFAALVILVHLSDPAYFGRRTDADLAKKLRMNTKTFLEKKGQLAKAGLDARHDVETMRRLLETVLPPCYWGHVGRMMPAFRALVVLFYCVSPASFNGLTQEELGRRLGFRGNSGTFKAFRVIRDRLRAG